MLTFDQAIEIRKKDVAKAYSGRRERDSFGYMEPDPNIPDFAQCSSCRLWLKDRERCHWLADDFQADADDSCIEYVQGKPILGQAKTDGSLTPEEVGFVSGKVRCENCVSFEGGTCNFYRKLNGEFPGTFALEEDVKPRACCNAFSAADDRVEIGKWNPKEPRNRQGKWRGSRRRRARKAFDPDQPRDDHGRWSGGGNYQGDDFAKAGVTATSNGIKVYNENVGTSPQEFKTAMTGGLGGDIRMRINGGGSTLVVQASGAGITKMERRFEFGDGTVRNVSFELDKSGLGKQIMASQIDAYQKMGMNRVTLNADTVGAYAWAKYGFVPDASDWRSIKASIRADQATSDPKSIWAVADSPEGKDILRGRAWEGTLDLKDSESMARFHQYTGMRKAFDPEEPRDTKGEWTAGGGVAGNPSTDRQGAGAFGDGKSVYHTFMDWRIGNHQDKVKALEEKSRGLTAQLAQHPNVSDDAHPRIRQSLMETNSDLWQARSDLKSLHEERDHPVRTVLGAIKETLVGKAVSFDEVLEKYSPDQARDGRGRWSSGSGSSAGSKAPAGQRATAFPKDKTPADHVTSLTRAGTDQAQFNAVMQDVRRLSPKDVKEVARSYGYGSAGAFKSKADALNRIESNFVRAARFENKIARDGRVQVRALSFDDVLAKYSPSQLRDARGRWTSGDDGWTAQTWADRQKGPPSPGGAFNKPLPKPKAGLGTDQGSRGRYWVYDHDWNLLDTYNNLLAAKNRGMLHTRGTNQQANLYDSQQHRETSTNTYRPGSYTVREAGWRTDAKGKTAWRDTTTEDAFIERFQRDRDQWERENGKVGKAQFYGEMRKRMSKAFSPGIDAAGVQAFLTHYGPQLAKAFNPDQERDTRGRWTAVESAVSTAKDVGRIMDKARLDDAHSAISPETDRNQRLLSTSGIHEWTDDPIEIVQEAKDFKPGDEHHDSLTNEERDQHRQQLHEDLNGVRDEVQGHANQLAAGLEKYSQYVDAYAARVKDTLGKVKDRIAQGSTAKAFDPDQPRDDHGKWSGSSGDQASLRAAQDRVRELTDRMSRLHNVDASEDIFWGTQRSLELARQDLDRQQGRMASMGKAFQPPGCAIMFSDVMKYRADQSRDNRGRWTSGGSASPAAAAAGGGPKGKKTPAAKAPPPAATKVTGPAKEVMHLLLTRRKLSPGDAAAALTSTLSSKGHQAPQFGGKTKGQFGEWAQGLLNRFPHDDVLNAALSVPRPEQEERRIARQIARIREIF